ncbi:prion-inhibition and propagation-domain-containing protein [Xylaria castorea]|nr:prion-inhibition and propagation-domain-containing protein [Xylaria castorea]
MEIAAAALQFASMAFQAFHGCVLAIEFFSTAQNMGADGDLFHAGLEFEKYRLMAWASRVGLLDDNESQTINWQLAVILLKQLESLLTSANVLRERYSLNVTEEEVQAMEELQVSEVPRLGVAKLIARLKPNLYTTTSKIIQENNSAVKRLRWAARDRNKLKAFLREISGLVKKLEFLLDSTERQQDTEEYYRLLREVISLTTTTVEVGQIKDLLEDRPDLRKGESSINAAAYLKQVRLVLGADKREDEVTPKLVGNVVGVKMPKLSILGRSLKPWNGSELYTSGLEFATYRNRQVLVQWKVIETAQWERYTNQMKCLAVFLMSLSDKSFRSLPCLGYYPLETQGRHGVVYSMPDDEDDRDFKSLKYLIFKTTARACTSNCRYSIATPHGGVASQEPPIRKHHIPCSS